MWVIFHKRRENQEVRHQDIPATHISTQGKRQRRKALSIRDMNVPKQKSVLLTPGARQILNRHQEQLKGP